MNDLDEFAEVALVIFAALTLLIWLLTYLERTLVKSVAENARVGSSQGKGLHRPTTISRQSAWPSTRPSNELIAAGNADHGLRSRRRTVRLWALECWTRTGHDEA